MSDREPILLTGVGRGASNIATLAAEHLLHQGRRVRVMIRRDDGRADGLRDKGAEIVVGDLSVPADVEHALHGVKHMFFNLSVSADYLKAAAVVASVAREVEHLQQLVNMSQMTVSQMTVTSDTESDQQRLHWLVEQLFDWSGLPVTHLRPTVFIDNPIFTTFPREGILQRGELALPFGDGHTSPIAAADVALAVATVLPRAGGHPGEVLELTGPDVLTLSGLADAYGRALGLTLTPRDIPLRDFKRQLEDVPGVSPHVAQHLFTIARLHREDRYDRLTGDFENLTDQPPRSVAEYIAANRELFTGRTS